MGTEFSKYKIITQPTLEPLSLQAVKDFCRITFDEDNQFIEELIKVARSWIESYLGRALITQTIEYYLDNFPDGDYIELPYPPLQSITSVKYKDTSGSEYTFSDTNYIADTVSEPGRLVLGYNKTFPSIILYPVAPITIKYIAGYGAGGDSVPVNILLAMKIIVEHFYENRELYLNNKLQSVPFSAISLLDNYRVNAFREF